MRATASGAADNIMRRAITLVVLFIFMTSTWQACGNPTARSGARLSIQAPATIAPGSRTQLTATETEPDGTTRDVTRSATWTSVPNSVLSIDNKGVATGIARGIATVGASEGGLFSVAALAVVEPGATLKLTGHVLASGFPVAGATVSASSVCGGSSCGSGAVQATTSTDGAFQLTVAGIVSLQATVNGVASPAQALNVLADTTADITVSTAIATSFFSGSWVATFTAPASCAANLPADGRQLRFPVTIAPTGASEVSLTFVADNRDGGPVRYIGSVTRGVFSLAMPVDTYDDYYGVFGGLTRRLSPTSWINAVGTVSGPATIDGVVGSLSGEFDAYTSQPTSTFLSGPPAATCAGTGAATLARGSVTSLGRRR
jgi:hypothetical protein